MSYPYSWRMWWKTDQRLPSSPSSKKSKLLVEELCHEFLNTCKHLTVLLYDTKHRGFGLSRSKWKKISYLGQNPAEEKKFRVIRGQAG